MIGICVMVMVKRQKEDGTMVCKTVAINKNLNSLLPLALAIEIGFVY